MLYTSFGGNPYNLPGFLNVVKPMQKNTKVPDLKHDRLYLLDLGRMHMPRSSFIADLHEEDPKADDDVVEFPICAHLIDSVDGRILYDTGCHPEAMGPNGRWPASYQEAYPWSGDESCQLPNRLEQLGLG